MGHLHEGVTIDVDPVDIPVGREGESNNVAEDIIEGGFGKQRLSSNCNTKRHCSSLRVGVELKEHELKGGVQLNFCSHNYVPPCSDSVA